MNFEKLKDAARKYEQKEEWRRAIEVYQKAIHEFESGHDPAPDLAIYNRVGDLYIKANEPALAVQAYEKAADLYREQGFLNNAVALCGKILRLNPGRIQTYLKLAHLHARKNVVIEAKKNLLEYLERMNALNQLDEAFKALKEFADEFPGNKEIRLMLSELLRASSRNKEAREQLEKLVSDLEARGDTVGARKTLQRLHAIESEETGEGSPAPKSKRSELIFLDTGMEAPSFALKPRPPRPSSAPSRRTPPPAVAPVVEASQVVEGAGTMGLDEGEPLTIEHSSLVEAPPTLEPVEPISDEAALELTSLDVGLTLGFEPTRVDDADSDVITPLEGLEIDVPLPDPMEPDEPLPDNLLVMEQEAELAIEHGDVLELDMDNLVTEEITLGSPNLLGPDHPSIQDVEDEADDLALDAEDLLATPEPTTPAPVSDPRPSPALPFLQMEEPTLPTIEQLEEMVFDEPDDPETHRALGEALLAAGESERGAEELDLALSAYENLEDWQHAVDVVNELIRLNPNGIRYYQKRVELAYRTGDRARLIEAYVELGDALMRAGAIDKALAVYRRVAEHDPENRRAQIALDALTPVEEPPPPPAAAPPPPEAKPKGQRSSAVQSAPAIAPDPPLAPPAELQGPDGDFIDLGLLILDEEGPMDTRMRVEDEEPTGDEQRDFDEMLMQFKRGIEENIAAEDFQSHYDLGVAFKEMGLLDEAIAEFQKALRAPEGRLKTSEALGAAFFDKGQFAIAEAILRRAVESLGASDDQQIGLIYWLGRAAEAQGKTAAAIPCYERVLAVDIGFQDAGARVAKLTAGNKR